MQTGRRLLQLGVVTFLWAGCLEPAAADHGFLRLDHLPGSSADPAHQGWMDVRGAGHSTLKPHPQSTPQHAALRIVKNVDRATPRLAFHLNRADAIPEGELHLIHREGDGSLTAYRLFLRDIQITAQSLRSEGSLPPSEQVDLSYRLVEWTYTHYTLAEEAAAYWDLSRNAGGLGNVPGSPPPDIDGDGIADADDPDDDNDGMPDAYEIENGLNPYAADGDGDRDADGQSNLTEYRAGTAAGSPSSFFTISGRVTPDGEVSLRWRGAAGRQYEVRAASSLEGPFSVLETLTATTDGELTTQFPASPSRQFFQVVPR